ncbi:MAG: VCBS repeat-containing protein [Candidatus Nitrohelix vancouverensis]|uniref:VCBS repeat-containing protein n=1 Tax=Candidatus Nitrohelix vancouverensis TaxID=2705534 RepID=A0A7T0C280_9BACT|nr:MAG: VCBS repeat-containing protein [Candidatus Nitrohelix vancouverensis]
MKILTRCFILISILLPALSHAQDRAAVDKLATQIEALFPEREGYVVSVEGDQLILDLKLGQDIKPGDRLKLIRYGDDIIHPVTKKKIGRKETDLGEVVLLDVRADFSTAHTLDPATKALAGDGVRLPFQQIKLLIAPPSNRSSKKIDSQQLQVNLQQSLAQRPRFETSTFELGLWMLENNLDLPRLLEAGNLEKLRASVDVDFILVPEVNQVKEQTVLNYQLHSARDGSVKKQARILARELPEQGDRPRVQAPPVAAQRQIAPKEMLEYETRQSFNLEILDLDVGDVNGDGKKDLVVITDKRVIILDPSGDKFKKLAMFNAPDASLNFISVDVGDFNKNGRDEIFVSAEADNKLASFILEVDGNRFRALAQDEKRYYRVLRPLDAPTQLVSQTSGFHDPFNGPVEILEFNGSGYAPAGALRLPEKYGFEFILYGLTQGHLTNKKEKDTLFLDNDFHLRVYSSDGRLIVKSDEYYGHDPRQISVGVREDVSGIVREGEPVQYRSRLELIRHKGSRYLLLPKNHRLGGALLSRMVIINNSSLVLLQATREGFEKVYETKKQKGYLAGYQVIDNGESGKHLVVATVTGTAPGETKRSTLFKYRWND